MKELSTKTKPVALALGYFDCLHLAHRAIISETVSYAAIKSLKSAVFTFSNEPPAKGVPVYPFKERKTLIEELGSDYIVPYAFDDSLMAMSAEQFLNMLTQRFDIRFLCCGSDYRFGFGALGDADFLKAYAAAHGIEAKILEPIVIDGEKVSTTLIKDELKKGEIKKVNRLLCSPYSIEGKVTIGKGRGQALGFPTANIKPCERFMPRFGVYASRTMLEGSLYPSITSIGTKPTFGDDTVTIETFICGNVFNLYAKNIRVELLDFIRELEKFSSAAKLKEQIKKDLQKAGL